MCIIVVKKKDIKMPSIDTLRNCYMYNSDGAGFMYVDNGDVVIEKGFMSWEEYKARLEELNKIYDNFKDKVFVSHFRIGTQGENDAHTCHPFPVSSKHKLLRKTNLRTDLGMCHNGIISDYGATSKYSKYHPKDKQLSDTQLFIRYTVNAFKSLNRNFYKNPEVVECLAHISEGSRLCFLDRNEVLTLTGDWVNDENGVLYSNTTYKSVRYYNSSFDWYDGYTNPYSESLLLDHSTSRPLYFVDAPTIAEKIDMLADYLPQYDGCILETTPLEPIDMDDTVIFESLEDIYKCRCCDRYYYDPFESVIYYVSPGGLLNAIDFGWVK